MRAPAAALAALLAAGAQAQESLEFTADATTGAGELTPTLTWATEPPADQCAAFGNWSGDKGVAGTETLEPVTETGTYGLECDWLGDPLATLQWVNPTENTDGTPYTTPGQTIIRYRREGDPRHQRGSGLSVQQTLEDCGDGIDDVRCVSGLDPSFVMHTVTGLSEGQWNFVVHSCNQANVCSQASPLASKVVTRSVTRTGTITITVSAIPLPPTNLEIE